VLRFDIGKNIVNQPGDMHVRVQDREQITTREQFINEIVNGHRTEFKNVDFKGTDREDLNLSGMNLSRLLFKNVRMENCDFSEAIMQDARIIDAVLNNVNFSDADLSDVGMHFSTATGVTMIGTKLERAKFEACDLTCWILADAKLGDAKISECNVRSSSFQRADLSNACIEGGEFEDINFGEAGSEAPAQINKITIRNASWRFAKVNLRCEEVEFDGGDFSHAKFNKSPFHSCSFKGPIELERCEGFSDLIGCKLENVNLLALERLPRMVPKLQSYEQEFKRHSRCRTLWKNVVDWYQTCPDEPYKLLINLPYYKKHIDWFDAEMRRHLREKVLALAERMPALQTEKSRALLKEIIALDDALTVGESNRSRGESVDTADSVSAGANQPPANGISNVDNQNNDVNSIRLYP